LIKPKKFEDIEIEQMDENRILFNKKREDVTLLNQSAWEIYNMCDGNLNEEEIAVKFYEKQDINMDVNECKSDVVECIKKLIEIGVLINAGTI